MRWLVVQGRGERLFGYFEITDVAQRLTDPTKLPLQVARGLRIDK